ncbi:hypothetical protein [Phreatobacter cathodiphilus]|uniref:Nitrate reductase n=1 Tax=Phreatobacter cathodiphilus TaxID=1868589 RepID=A0A2S0N6N9_9HYPH|nr:hypothetical protein [Phreatobacter cathodiphilus]AVO43603.1 hypothetical protein C6569_00040 [Phreatobacter cathodiphilus]
MARFFFNRRGQDPETADASRRLTTLVRDILSLSEDDGVTVSEIACSHPECGDAETVVLVMRVGRRTEAVKVLKAMRLVTEDELRKALAQSPSDALP